VEVTGVAQKWGPDNGEDHRVRITGVRTYPLTVPVGDLQRTSQGSFGTISILVVVVETDAGITGVGEALARYGPKAYAELVNDLLAPKIAGLDPFAVEAVWLKLYRTFSGRSGGMLIEAIAALDTALWDIMGKAAGRPVHELLGHMGRERVRAYASSIPWTDDGESTAWVERCLGWGFKEIKVKIGAPVEAAIARAKLVREVVGPGVRLMADANWIFDVDEALEVGRALGDLGYFWLEEPIVPEDLEGYKLLRSRLPLRLAAGESEHTAQGAAALLTSRAVGVIQPDVARSGGITETRKIATLAHALHVPYAPHVGASGAVCVAATLHLAAAMPNFLTFECMIFPNPLRDRLLKEPVGAIETLEDGALPLPKGPGLGVELDMAEIERWTER
jgi:D-galactarolactone cycloisomerase